MALEGVYRAISGHGWDDCEFEENQIQQHSGTVNDFDISGELPEGLAKYAVVPLVAINFIYPSTCLLSLTLLVGWTAKKLLTGQYESYFTEQYKPDFNRVYHIDSPPKLNQSFLKQYTGKIVELCSEKKWHIIGFALIEEILEGRVCPVYIKSHLHNANGLVIQFSVHTLESNKEIGYADCIPVAKTYNSFKTHQLTYVNYNSNNYVFTNHLPGVFLQEVVVRESEKYRYIEALLIKAIFMSFCRDCHGFMAAEIKENNHAYFYKLGFRALNKDDEPFNAIFARMANSGKVKENRPCLMGLSKDAIKLWLDEVMANPIVSEDTFNFQILLHQASQTDSE